MSISSRTIPSFEPPPRDPASRPLAKKARDTNPSLNTLDQVLAFTRSYSAEIRQDAKARRIYKSFSALTNTPFEALLAFAIWKLRGIRWEPPVTPS